MADSKKLVPFILRWEGGYVNDPTDRGGETNKGITIKTWKGAGHDTTEKIADMKVGNRTYKNVTKSLYEMTDDQWHDIYKKNYWDLWKADQIKSQSVANILVDWLWGSGTGTIKKVQQIVGVTADGKVGPKTIEAVNKQDPAELFQKVYQARKQWYENIVARDPKQGKFLKGWMNRLNSLQFKG